MRLYVVRTVLAALGALAVALMPDAFSADGRERSYRLRTDSEAANIVYVTDWLVCGPFFRGIVEDYENPQQPADDHLGPIGGEAGARPFPGCSFYRGRVWFEWTEAHSPDTKTNFLSEYSYIDRFDSRGRRRGYMHLFDPCIYAACYLEAAERIEARLRVWTAAGHRVYLRSDRLKPTERDARTGEQMYGCRLDPGRNRLLLRVAQARGAFQFKVGLEFPRAEDARRVAVPFWPPGPRASPGPRPPRRPRQRLELREAD
ncbi:MAG TPA: hypothetical protein EYP14_13795, partial [Planctomycetaceae bacterium]|nr:hypothetical protein [Planctomycetaceae bacterium]